MVPQHRLPLASLLISLAVMGCDSKPAQSKANPTSNTAQAPRVDAKGAILRYAGLVHQSYVEAHDMAKELERATDTFIADPTEEKLAAARLAWIAARPSYGVTEAFRFYEGPIDAPGGKGREEGPEGRLNGWPLNEAYIDYVQGDPKAGIIQQGKIPITVYELKHRNASEDEADITTGYHAIEFLLWGQDLSATGPGERPVSDFQGDSPTAQRRREYLAVVTDLLVSDLQTLVEAWKPDAENYRAAFLKLDEKEALGKVLTGLATLSGFELASERIGVPLDSGSQEDEQSCFSDNTREDYIANVRSIRDVCLGPGGVLELLNGTAHELSERLKANLLETEQAAMAVDSPIDAVLASPPGSEGRAKLERLAALLREQAELLVEAGGKLGVKVTVAAE